MILKENVVVIESRTLSDSHNKRYVVANKETGEIVDDAQGYGYKSIKNAYTSFSYKNRDISKDANKEKKLKHILHWMREHKSFVRAMDAYSFEIAKGSWGPDDRFDAKLVARMLKDHGLHPDFTPGELLQVWRKR